MWLVCRNYLHTLGFGALILELSIDKWQTYVCVLFNHLLSYVKIYILYIILIWRLMYVSDDPAMLNGTLAVPLLIVHFIRRQTPRSSFGRYPLPFNPVSFRTRDILTVRLTCVQKINVQFGQTTMVKLVSNGRDASPLPNYWTENTEKPVCFYVRNDSDCDNDSQTVRCSCPDNCAPPPQLGYICA